jgi:hypothetical protein
MKNLKNETTTIEVSTESNEKTTFVDLAKACVNNIDKQKGLDVLEMSARLAVMKKLDNKEKEIKLEDAEALTLKKCVSEMRWIVLHEDVLRFIETIEKL